MASNHTQHFALNRWDLNDQIIMDDFNDDNAKIDAALHDNAATLSALQTTLNTHGKLTRFAYGSYVGTGESGQNHPNSLTFDFYPMFIIIMSRAAQGRDQSPCFMMRGETVGNSTETAASINLSWTDSGVSWYDVDSFSEPENQNNTEGVTYHYLAFGEAR